MKKIFTLTIMAVMSVATFAQRPYGEVSAEGNNYLQNRQTKNVDRVEFKAQPASISLSRSKATLAEEAIVDQPEGELTLMRREGTDWLPVWGQPAPADYTEKGTYVVKGTDGNYYFKNFVTNMCNGGTWVKGTVNGNVVSVATGQICTQLWYDNGVTNEQYTYYLLGLKGEEATGIDWYGEEYTYTVYVYDETVESVDFQIQADGSLTPLNPEVLFGGLEEIEGELTWPGYGDENCSFVPFSEEPQTAPEGLDFKDYVFINKPYMSNDVYAIIKGAVTDDAFYFNGLTSSVTLPEGYAVKATIDGDKAVIANNQFLGVDNTYSTLVYLKVTDPSVETDEWGYSTIYDAEGEQLVLTYDAETKRFSKTDDEDGFLINAGKNDILPHDHFYAPTFYEFSEQPAMPSLVEFTYYYPYTETEYSSWGYLGFNQYTNDVDGNYILPEKLYYRIYFDDQPMSVTLDDGTEIVDIPYAFNSYDIVASREIHYIYFYQGDFERIGVQTIYKGGNETTTQVIQYYGEETTGIQSSTTTTHVVSTIYTDAAGRQHNGLVKGLNIVTLKYADGSQKTTKFFVK